MSGMAIMTVDPCEGLGIVPGGDWSANHQGVDRPTPRIWDYTAPSDGVIEIVGGTYHQIVARRTDGTRWRIAEVSEILVVVGQQVSLGQVIGRNAYYRGGIFRALHQNAGGDSGRSRFSGIVTHSKAAAAAILAAGQVDQARKRTVKAGVNANRRMGPGTKFNEHGTELKAGTVGNFIAFAHGPVSQGQPVGNDVWYQGISGDWFWSGAFTSANPGVLPDKTSEFTHYDTLPVPPVVVVPVEPVEPPEGPIVETPQPPVIVIPDPEPPVVAPPVEPPVVVDPPVIVDPPVVVPPVEPPVVTPPKPSVPKPVAVSGIVAGALAIIALVWAAISGLFQ